MDKEMGAAFRCYQNGRLAEAEKILTSLYHSVRTANASLQGFALPALVLLITVHRDRHHWKSAEEVVHFYLHVGRRVHGSEHPEYAACLLTAGNFECDRDGFSEALAHFNKAVEILEPVADLHRETLASALSRSGLCLRELTQFDEAERLQLRAWDLLSATSSLDQDLRANLLDQRARIELKQHKTSEAEDHIRQAIALSTHATNRDNLFAAKLKLGLVWALSLQARVTEAIPLCDEQIEFFFKKCPDSLEVAAALVARSRLHWQVSEVGRGAEFLERSAAMLANVKECHSRLLWTVLDFLSGIYLFQERYSEVEAAMDRALELPLPAPARYFPTWVRLASLALEQHDVEMAETRLVKAGQCNPTSFRGVWLLAVSAGAARQSGDTKRASDFCSRAISKWEELGRRSCPEGILALTEAAIQQPDSAEGLLQEARKMIEHTSGPDSPAMARWFHRYAAFRVSTGDVPSAATWFQKALALYSKALGDEHPKVQRLRKEATNSVG